MARYIDADMLIKKVFPYDVVDKKCYSINAKMIYEAIKKAPTADVVPKSEVEELSGKYEDLKLKHIDLAKDYDELIAWGGHIKSKDKEEIRCAVAREIFEEIEKILIDSKYIPDCARFVDIDKLAELEKKYTEDK